MLNETFSLIFKHRVHPEVIYLSSWSNMNVAVNLTEGFLRQWSRRSKTSGWKLKRVRICVVRIYAFPVVAKMSLNKQLYCLVVFFGLTQAQEAYFLYKDPLGVMVNYTGSIENGNIPHGFGIGHFMDENPTYTYTGEWKHGLATGFGKIRYANGDTYVGKVNFINFFKVLLQHTDAKSQFLSNKSILTKSTPTLNLNFPTKTGIIDNLIF